MRVLKSKALHVVLVLLLSFVPLAISFNPIDLYVYIGSVLFAASVAVVHAYWPALKVTLNQPTHELELVDYLALGIVMVFLFTSFREAYITIYRELYPVVKRPNEYYLPLAFARYGAVIAAFMALIARSATDEHGRYGWIPGWPRSIIALLVGSAIGLTLIYLR